MKYEVLKFSAMWLYNLHPIKLFLLVTFITAIAVLYWLIRDGAFTRY